MAVGADRGDARPDGDLVTTDRAAALLEDVLGEPTMLDGLLDAYGAKGGPLSELPKLEQEVRVVFAGLGSSRYAALDAAVVLQSAGLPAWVEFASVDAATPPSRDVVLVAISASGRTPETVAVAERHRGTSLVVAVTNQPESPLAAAGDVVLPLHAGVETSGVSSRTFLATITVLGLLCDRLHGRAPDVEALRPVVEGLDAVLEGRGAWLATTARAPRRRRRDRRHRTGSQPGTCRAGRAPVPGGAAPACLGARGSRLGSYRDLHRASRVPRPPPAGDAGC